MSIEYSHRQKELEFRKEESNLEQIEIDIAKLEDRISSSRDWIERNKLQQELSDANKCLESIKSKKNKMDYYMDIAPIVKQYNEPDINLCKSINDTCEGTMMNFITKTEGKQNKRLFDKFNHIVYNTTDKYDAETTDQSYYCNRCNNIKVLVQNESNLVCEYCGDVEYFLDNTHTSVTYEQEVNTESNINHGIYKRMSHFSDILSNCQAKNNVSIPEPIIEQIKGEFSKQKVVKITFTKIKPVLKKLGLSKYYEQIPKIYSIVSNEDVLQIPQDVEENLKLMFRMIQDPFEKHKPKTRSNFLSYSYCFFQLLTLLEQNQYRVLFPLLKSREKIREQDKIWKDICNELDWEFIPAPVQ